MAAKPASEQRRRIGCEIPVPSCSHSSVFISLSKRNQGIRVLSKGETKTGWTPLLGTCFAPDAKPPLGRD